MWETETHTAVVRICPPDHSHGESNVCYVRHKCRCDDCTCYNTEYAYWRRHQDEPLTVPSASSIRRIQALGVIGWTRPALAREAGVRPALLHNTMNRKFIRRRTRDVITALYDRFCMTPAHPKGWRERAGAQAVRNHARTEGWLSPMEWEDIEAGLVAKAV